MASNNPINYSNLPMGSHATAGAPHMPASAPMNAGSLQGTTQGTSLAAHQGMSGPQATINQPFMPPVSAQIPLPQYPTGQQVVAGMPVMPLGSFQQLTGAAPVDFDVLGPMPIMDPEYTQGYLRTQIGKKVKVEFLIGADNYTDRQGVLVDVGISYIILNETDTDDLLLCDIYSIKFVRFYY